MRPHIKIIGLSANSLGTIEKRCESYPMRSMVHLIYLTPCTVKTNYNNIINTIIMGCSYIQYDTFSEYVWDKSDSLVLIK